MSKIFFVRHQAGGVLVEFPFNSPPTEAQVAPILAQQLERHGATHPKSKDPYWTRVVEYELLQPGQVPVIEKPASDLPDVPGPKAVGAGTVTPLSDRQG